jgi:RNA polymerase sigma-70 factor (ECF subfamily)
MPAGAASGASIGGGVGAPVGADAAGGGTAHRAIELAARTSYGRLVAVLAARSRDVAAAEDALGDAFAAALAQWPAAGVPANPEGWLVAAARRRLADGRRRAAVRDAAADDLAYAASFLAGGSADAGTAAGPFPDRRLGLLFACAHPAVDPNVRTPLMLQVVLGLDAREIASAFLESPSATAQRLVRAKRKLRDAGIPFAVPEREELAPRLTAVLEAIYAAFGAGWDAVVGGDPGGSDDPGVGGGGAAPARAAAAPTGAAPGAAAPNEVPPNDAAPHGPPAGAHRADLADEAIWLGRLVVDALPGEPEPRGLLALMLYCHARRAARTAEDGAYVPLAEQAPGRWSLALIGEAEAALAAAARHLRPGRFQLEAAIQSAHLAPAFGRPADWRAVAALYDALLAYAPTAGALVARAAALGEAEGAEAGLAACDAVPAGIARDYQPWWALRAHLLARLARHGEARAAYERAAGLTQAPAVRAFLLGRRDRLGPGQWLGA